MCFTLCVLHALARRNTALRARHVCNVLLATRQPTCNGVINETLLQQRKRVSVRNNDFGYNGFVRYSFRVRVIQIHSSPHL